MEEEERTGGGEGEQEEETKQEVRTTFSDLMLDFHCGRGESFKHSASY